MKKIAILTLATWVAISGVSASDEHTYEQMNLDQLLNDVRTKVEQRRQERVRQLPTLQSSQPNSTNRTKLDPRNKRGAYPMTGMVPGKRKHNNPFASSEIASSQNRQIAKPLTVSFPRGYTAGSPIFKSSRRQSRSLALNPMKRQAQEKKPSLQPRKRAPNSKLLTRQRTKKRGA